MQRRLRRQEDAAQVHGEQEIPLLLRQFVHARRAVDARTRDEHVETAEALERGVDEPLCVIRLRDVDSLRARDVRAELGGGRGSCVGVQVAEHDARALGNQRASAGEADPAGASRDDRDLAREPGLHHTGQGRTS